MRLSGRTSPFLNQDVVVVRDDIARRPRTSSKILEWTIPSMKPSRFLLLGRSVVLSTP